MPIFETSSGLSINYVRTGPANAPPLVFLHALGLDLTWWDHQVAGFGHDHDVIAIDLPGHGLSGRFNGPPTFDGMAQATADVLDHLGAGPAHVVGLSVGGMTAQTLAVTKPGLVRSLTLVATSCTFPEPVRELIRERARITRAGGMAAIAPQHVERWFPAPFRARRPDVPDRAAKLLLQQDPELHASLWDMVAALELKKRLQHLDIPTMVIAGAEDVSASPAAGQLIADQIAGAILQVMPGCGHFPAVEDAPEFNTRLRHFLSKA